MQKETVEKAIFETGTELGLDIVEITFIGDSLRIYIYKPGGVNLDDCKAFSKKLNEHFETLRIDEYSIEVSSPGMQRTFKSNREFKIFQGRRVRVKHWDHEQPVFTEGLLKEATDTALTLTVGETDKLIPMDKVIRGQLG